MPQYAQLRDEDGDKNTVTEKNRASLLASDKADTVYDNTSSPYPGLKNSSPLTKK